MKIGIIGAGSWGTALALAFFRAGNETCIFVKDEQVAQEIALNQENTRNLPGVHIPSQIKLFHDYTCVDDLDLLVLVTPAQTIREICLKLKSCKLNKNLIILIAAKGIEQNSCKLMSEVVEENISGHRIAIISGPNYANLVAKDLPSITTIAASDEEIANFLASKLSSRNFRIYPSNDLIGAQVIGAAKNVLAIASGIVRGKQLGENAEAAIFSRGINEIMLLNKALGGKESIILSPAGLGDLYLTCSSSISRNTAFGLSLAKGEKNFTKLVEGFYTVKSICELASRYSISLPICQAVYDIAWQDESIDVAIERLLDRKLAVT